MNYLKLKKSVDKRLYDIKNLRRKIEIADLEFEKAKKFMIAQENNNANY